MTTAAHTPQQSAERPRLSLVKDEPDVLDGTVVEHGGDLQPAWIHSDAALARAVRGLKEQRLYLPWVARGYARLGRRWAAARRDYYPQLIRSAEAALRAADGNVQDELKCRNLLDSHRAEYKRHKLVHAAKASGWAVAVTGSGTVGALTGGLWVDLVILLSAMGIGAYNGRPDQSTTAQIQHLYANEHEPLDGIDGSDDGIALTGSVMTVDQLGKGRPFPLAQARTPEQLAECVLRAMVAEGVPIAEVTDVERHPWGWQCTIRVNEGTPEAVIKVAGDLETRFDLPTNGVRVQPRIERRACAILRLVDGDPFASAPGLPYRAPRSISITDKSRIGTSVGGDPLEVALAGVMGLLVAASGGGKTGLLQALGEVTTACYDNITIDLDPHGDGLEDLHDAVRITARTHEQIEAVLFFLLMLSKGRARLRKRLGMGKKWKISPEHPAITVIFDEFPKASELAKRLTFDLLLVGRKEAVQVEFASQGGTKLYLGESIAQMIAMKALGPCKVGDTRAVFGDGAVGEGWMPHRLSPATDTDPKDAGHIYIQGVPGRPDEPIEYAVHETPSATLKKLATERREAGFVEPDEESLAAMQTVDLPDYVQPVFDGEGNLKRAAPVELLTWDQLLRLCDAEPRVRSAGAGSSRAIVTDALDLMDKAGVDRMRTERLTEALRDYDPDTYGSLTPDGLKALMREAGAGAPVPIGAADGLTNPRGFKRETLTALA